MDSWNGEERRENGADVIKLLGDDSDKISYFGTPSRPYINATSLLNFLHGNNFEETHQFFQKHLKHALYHSRSPDIMSRSKVKIT